MCVTSFPEDQDSTLLTLNVLTEDIQLRQWLYSEVREAVGKLIRESKPASLHLCLCVVVIKDFYSHPSIPLDWPLI